MKFIKSTLAIALSSALLSGCFSSSSSSSSGSSEGTSTTSVSGTASKGIIVGGVVVAEQLTSAGVVELGRTNTDANGDYAVPLPADFDPTAGVVRVRIIPGSATTMVCDAPAGCAGVAFGDPISLLADSGFEMAAVVNAEAGDAEVSVQITPFSHMAASAAGALGASPGVLDASDVVAANATITQLVGFDILETDATDLATADDETSSASTQFALLNAAIATNMFSGTDAVADLLSGLDDLADAMADGSLDADGTGSDAFTIDALQAAVTQTLTDVATLGDDDLNIDVSEIEDAGDTVNDYQENVVDVEFADGLDTDDITVSENQSDVDDAKELIGNVRTLVQEIADTDFDTPVDAFGVDAETAEAVFSDESSQILQMVGDALDSGASAIDDAYPDGILEALNADADKSITVDQAVTDEEGNSLGSLTVVMSETSGGYSLVVSGTLTDGTTQVTVTDLTVTLSGADSFNGLEDSVADFLTTDGLTLLLSGTVSDGSTSLQLTDTTLAATLTETTTFTDGDEDTELSDVIASLSFTGGAVLQANGAQFEGDIQVSLVRLADTAVRTVEVSEMPLSLDLVSLSGTFTKDTKSFTAEITLDIDGANAFDGFSFANFESDPYFNFESDDLSDADIVAVDAAMAGVFTIPAGANISSANVSIFEDGTLAEAVFSDGTESGSVSITGNQFNDLVELLLAGQYGTDVLPDTLDVDYFNYWLNTAESDESWMTVSGSVELMDFETTDSFLQGDLRIESELTLPDLPEMQLVTTLERDSLNGGSLTVTPFWGTETYTLEFVSVDLDADQVAVTLTITDPVNGVVVVAMTDDVDAAEFSGTVTVDGTQVATISDSNGIPLVRYDDGTFESLY